MTLNRLTCLFERFRVSATLFQAGPLCGVSHYGAEAGVGHLHVVRSGNLALCHQAPAEGLPARLRVEAPALVFYPRPVSHDFVIPEAATCDLVCAALRFQGGAMHPLQQALPALVVVPLAEAPALLPTLDLLFSEAESVQAGERLLADRLFEVLLIQLLRWLMTQPGGAPTGLLAGLAHPAVSKALTALHQRPGEAWSLPALAHEAGLSRSVFAAVFHEVVGHPPMDYLAQWRLALVQQGLVRGTPLKRLADELGYSSASALSRAFAVRFGVRPRAWWAQQRA